MSAWAYRPSESHDLAAELNDSTGAKSLFRLTDSPRWRTLDLRSQVPNLDYGEFR